MVVASAPPAKSVWKLGPSSVLSSSSNSSLSSSSNSSLNSSSESSSSANGSSEMNGSSSRMAGVPSPLVNGSSVTWTTNSQANSSAAPSNRGLPEPGPTT
jgi:hypothetical protein